MWPVLQPLYFSSRSPPRLPDYWLKLRLSGPDSMGLYIEEPGTDLAVSVRFQAHSSILAGSAPAANYNPPPPRQGPPLLVQLTQASQCPTKPRPREKEKSQVRLSAISLRPAQRGGAEIAMGALEDVMGLPEMPPFAFSIQV